MDFCSPIGVARVERAIELMGLTPGMQIVDFGAGKCGWLGQIAMELARQEGEAVRGKCFGVEPARVFAEEARRRQADLVASGRLEVVESSASEFLSSRGGEQFDAALCVGSTHAFGGHERTLDTLAACVREGGVMVVAEGYWKRPPNTEYLEVLGGDETEFTTHAGNIERAIARGLTPRWACTVTDDEWDEYEWGYSRGIESFVRENPGDPDAEAMKARSRGWREAYVKWGRDTLGFGLYVLGK